MRKILFLKKASVVNPTKLISPFIRNVEDVSCKNQMTKQNQELEISNTYIENTNSEDAAFMDTNLKLLLSKTKLVLFWKKTKKMIKQRLLLILQN